MSKPTQIFLGIGGMLLLLGLLCPWVSLAPPAKKDANLTQLADILNHMESLPQPIQDTLQKRGWKARRTLPEIKAFFVNEPENGHTFTQLYKEARLYSWDFLRLETTGTIRVLAASLIGLCILSGAVSLYSLWQTKSTSAQGEDDFEAYEWEDGEWEDEGYLSTQRHIGQADLVIALIAIVSFVAFFAFITQMPLLDSLGRAGDRSMLLIDVVFDMRVKCAPRLLIPVGLLLLMLAGFESVITVVSSNKSIDTPDESW